MNMFELGVFSFFYFATEATMLPRDRNEHAEMRLRNGLFTPKMLETNLPSFFGSPFQRKQKHKNL